jgi:CheY-specific phosphatase CheX
MTLTKIMAQRRDERKRAILLTLNARSSEWVRPTDVAILIGLQPNVVGQIMVYMHKEGLLLVEWIREGSMKERLRRYKLSAAGKKAAASILEVIDERAR